MSLMTEIFKFVLSYILVLLIGFGLIQFLSNGFVGTFIRVKASRGRLNLVRLHTLTGVIYRAGKISEGLIIFKNLEKQQKRIYLKKKNVYRHIGVNCVDIDDETNEVLDPIQWGAISHYDAVKFDNLLQRALSKPSVHSNHEKIILLLLIIIAIGLAFAIYNIIRIQGALPQLTGTII